MTIENSSLLLNVFEKTPDLVCIVDKRGNFLQINPAVVHTLGFTREELFAQPVSTWIHPDDRHRTAEAREYLLNNTPLLNFQNRYVAKDGRIVWLQWTSVYIPEMEVVFAIAKDITEKKLAEMETEANLSKYRELTRHFKDLVEKDRAFFAFELHEELGQLATVIKQDFEWVSTLDFDKCTAIQKRLDLAAKTIQLLIDKIRKLSYTLGPSQLEELGLHNVLEELCREFSSLSNVDCKYASSFPEEHLTSEIKLDLFRICQESLANIMRQAGATQVRIELAEYGNEIRLTIQDNGKGFSTENQSSFGLEMIKGRAESINGVLSISGSDSDGTSITVTIQPS